MAIHDDLPGIEVTVKSNGYPLLEYDTENDRPSHRDISVRLHEENWTRTNYIESFTGGEFSIGVAIHPGHTLDCPNIGFKVVVDGVKASEPLLRPQDAFFVSRTHDVMGMYSSHGGTGYLRKFKFAQIHTTDEGDMEQVREDGKKVSKMGEIVVTAYRYSGGNEILGAVHVSENGLKMEYDHHGNATSVFHEKALKGEAKSHGVALGHAQPAQIGKVINCYKLDGEDYPLARFVFKYRSNEALKQLMIIERTPEPELTPEPEEHPLLDGLTAQERHEVEELAARLKKKRTHIKDEDEENRKRGRYSETAEPVVTIDLTADDEEDDIAEEEDYEELGDEFGYQNDSVAGLEWDRFL